MDNKYTFGELKGIGTFGTVYKALNRVTGDTVAVKVIDLKKVSEGIPSAVIREVALLKEVEHENIVRLLDVVLGENSINLVFENLDCDLAVFLHRHRISKHPEFVKNFLLQILRAVAYCHSQNIIHRDLKPQNLLVDLSNYKVKLADFGLARAIDVPQKKYTKEVATPHYMAPELLFRTGQYSKPADVWSVGCIFGEMVRHRLMFSGGGSLFEQLTTIFRVMGTPNEEIWPGVTSLYPFLDSFEPCPPKDLSKEVPGLEPDGVDLLSKMLYCDPSKRITAHDALKHSYFRDVNENLP